MYEYATVSRARAFIYIYIYCKSCSRSKIDSIRGTWAYSMGSLNRLKLSHTVLTVLHLHRSDLLSLVRLRDGQPVDELSARFQERLR